MKANTMFYTLRPDVLVGLFSYRWK